MRLHCRPLHCSTLTRIVEAPSPLRIAPPDRSRRFICYQRRKVNVSQVFAGQKVGVKQTDDHIWLVTFMDYDLGYFDDETCRLEPIDNPFGSKLLPMSPE